MWVFYKQAKLLDFYIPQNQTYYFIDCVDEVENDLVSLSSLPCSRKTSSSYHHSCRTCPPLHSGNASLWRNKVDDFRKFFDLNKNRLDQSIKDFCPVSKASLDFILSN